MIFCSLNPSLNILRCPNRLYNTVDRITDWDAGLPLYFELVFFNSLIIFDHNSFILDLQI